MKLQKLINPLTIIFIAAVLRLLSHPANVAPIAAMALFGGAYLNKKYALIVPLLAMMVSDIFLGFYPEMIFVYGSFLLIGLLGLLLRKHINTASVIAASLFSSVIFFIITNLGVWLMGNWYPKTLAGLVDCFVMALPFFRNTIIGDLVYTCLFFGGYALVSYFLKKKSYANLY
jgi:hypothetical protein